MRFNIAAFTHVGTERQINQDRILVQDSIYKEGLHSLSDVERCFCFVADGIGGGPAGEFAAQFILEQIAKKIAVDRDYTKDELRKILMEINTDLIQVGRENPEYQGAGTTLVGIIIRKNQFHVINAGDSQAWLLRNTSFLKITEEQVLDPFQKNSPITSYFGGKKDELHLEFDTVLRNVMVGDVFLLTSDGLFKALEKKQIKAILSNNKPLKQKATFMLQKALKAGAEDNLGCILIEITE